MSTALVLASVGTSANADPALKVELIPAFSTDLPTSGTSFSPDSAQATAWTCTVYASDPYWEDTGYVLGGDGWQSCNGSGYQNTKVIVRLQRYLGLGIWSTVVSDQTGWSSSSWREMQVYYDCNGTGNEEYRVTTTGYAESGSYGQSTQSLNYLRVTC